MSKFKYISHYMLIYVKFLKLSDCLRHFMCGYLKAHSICPTNIFRSDQKLCILEQNINFLAFCKPNPHGTENSMCNKVNTLQIHIHYFFFLASCTQICSQYFVVLLNPKLFNVPTNVWILYILENVMFRKVRNCTPNQEN